MAYDHVIVGGGSAGSVLATRLSADPSRSVLLIEAGETGPLDSDDDRLSNVSFALTKRDWGMKAFVRPDRELEYPQGKFLGGGSSVNGALAVRGAPADYDGWAAVGNPSWSWEHMLRCLRRLERDLDYGDDGRLHGGDGPIPIVRYPVDELLPIQQAFGAGASDAGLGWVADHNDPTSTGVGPVPMNRSEGRRVSTALAYLGPVLDRPNLTVWGRALVDRVRVVDGRAVGVEVLRDGARESVDAGEVILSAGALRTPGILWRTGIGPAAELRGLGLDVLVDNPAVGANLHDHPGLFLFGIPGPDGPGPVEPQFQLMARYSSTSGGIENDMLLSMMNFWDLSAAPDFQEMVGAPAVVVLTCGVHQPWSRGRVALVSSDPTEHPRVEFNLLDDPRDVERLVEGLRMCHGIARSAGMKAFVDRLALLDDAAFDDDAALAAYARNVVAGWYHPVGTCRMGPEGVDTVVGDDLRVHGVDGLRVVDASIMPRIVRAPTNLTSIAIGERAAELLTA